jgi:hypothetical protein
MESKRCLRDRASKVSQRLAAIARCHNASVAPRNTGDFEDCGLRLINPWIA